MSDGMYPNAAGVDVPLTPNTVYGCVRCGWETLFWLEHCGLCGGELLPTRECTFCELGLKHTHHPMVVVCTTERKQVNHAIN